MGSVRFILTGPISCWLRQYCKQKRVHAVEFISWKSLDRKTTVKQSCLIRAIVKAGAVVLVIVTGAAAGNGRPTQPNVVLLLTDDLGWQDVKCYDIDDPSPMETPNIDALAKQGVMFWQAYAPAPTCAPTRCAIMSGNHPARAQKTHVVGGAPPRRTT